jgi:hypothetical protein
MRVFFEVLPTLVSRLYMRFPLHSMAQTAASLILRSERRVQTAVWRIVSPASLARIAIVLTISFSVQQSLVYAQAPSQPKVPVKHSSARPMITGTDGSQTGIADFQGNFTAISVPSSQVLGLARETNCSLTLLTGNYSLGSSLTYTRTGITSNYDVVLHTEAGLTTTAGSAYAGGCSAPATGFSSRSGLLVGTTTSGINVFAGINFSPLSMGNALYVLSGTDATTYSISISSLSTAGALIAGDLNDDGNGDLVVLNSVLTTSGSVSVLLGNADGSFQGAVSYPTTGPGAVAAVLDDVNGDGKLDLVVLSAALGSVPQQISVLLGNGNGSFQAAQSFAVPVLPGYTSSASTPIVNIITADLRGDGKKDIICSSGLVLLGNGDGTFTPASNPAFPYSDSLSAYGPNLTSGDINKDGKQDVVISTGGGVFVYLGNGDGTFTPGSSYASINSFGFVTIDDLDGDGNPDIYVGMANGAVGNNGVFEGDGDDQNFSYALMGYGNGTFSGAPVINNSSVYGVYTGTNLGDVNGDGIPDLITNPTNQYNQTLPAFTVQLGNGKGAFTSASTIVAPASFTATTSALTSPVTITNANTVGATSYAVADVNGDDKADLVFVDNGLTAINPGSGLPITYPAPIYFVALSNGDGTFATPVPYNFPQIASASGFDVSVIANTVQIADFNHDGHPDLIFTYNDQAGGPGTVPYNQGFAILTGKGDGTFSTTAILTPTYSSNSVPTTAFVPTVLSTVDLNGDGKPDLIVNAPGTVITNFQLQTAMQIYIGNGDGTFKTPTTIPAADEYGIPVVADLNKDGKLDLAFLAETSASQAELVVALGNGDGTFATPTVLNLSGGDSIRNGGLAAADFNADGNPDLALIDSADYSGIFYGNGGGTFVSVPQTDYVIPKDLINLAAIGSATAVDLNKDGKPDLLAGNTILLNIYGAVSIPPALTSTTAALTASSATISTGASITFTATITPTSGPTGTVTFYDGTAVLGTQTITSGTATYTTSTLSAGSHTITAVYSGDTAFSTSTSSAIPINVNAVSFVATTTTLASSTTTAVSRTSLTFTATVTPTSGTASPTGTVTFTDGSTTLGTGTLASGKTTFTTNILSVGSHAITAAYSGDTIYASSTSGTTIINITAAAPGDFSIAMSPSSGTVSRGNSITSTLTISPSGGFSQQVSFVCSGLPRNTSCSLSPTTVTPIGTSAATSTLTIKTNVASASLYRPALPSRGSGGTTTLAFLGGGGLLGLTLLRRHKKKLWYAQLSLALMILTASMVVGCGGSSSTTPTGTYQVNITGTAGSTVHSITYSLSVQ